MSDFRGFLHLSAASVSVVPVGLYAGDLPPTINFGGLTVTADRGEDLAKSLRALAERVEHATAQYGPLLASGQTRFVEVSA
jgi:hypothetical protein